MSKIDINVEQVFGALNSVKFDIGGNTYGVMTSISAYINSIYEAVASLGEGWSSSYNSVAEYVESFYGVPVPDRNPEPESGFLNDVPVNQDAALYGGNTSSQNSATSSESGRGSSTSNSDSTKNKNKSAVALVNGNEKLPLINEKGAVVGYLEPGDQLTILNDSKGSLAEVQLSNGIKAYADYSRLNVVQKGSAIARVNIGSSNNRLNVRSSPNGDSNILTTLKDNASVEVVGTSENGWTKIKLNNQETGYVNSTYLKI